MTSSDLPHVNALLERAQRGTPRGATAVLAAAREDLPTPRPQTSRRSHRALGVAAAVVVAAAVGGSVLGSRERTTTPSGADATWCAALGAAVPGAPGTEGDVVAYLRPERSDADLDALAGALAADRRVIDVAPFDRAATYERFLTLFPEGQVTGVTPADLPTSVAIDLIDPADAGELIAELNVRPGTFVAVPGWGRVRALDLLVWPGAQPGAWDAPGNVDLGTRPYPPAWATRAEAIAASTPTDLAGPVQTLLDRIAVEPMEQRATEAPGEPGPTFEAARDAAATVRAAASERCGLEVPDRFTRTDAATTATTFATGD